VKSPTSPYEKAPALSKALQRGAGSAGEIRTRPLTADAGQILAAWWRTVPMTTGTNVPPAGHALGEGGADRTRVPGRRVKGYYLDRGVNARVRRLSHGARKLVPIRSTAGSLRRSRPDLLN
jgi:hypothetical protein